MSDDDTRASLFEFLLGGLVLVVGGGGLLTWVLVDWLVDEFQDVTDPTGSTVFGIVVGVAAMIAGLVCLTVAAAGHGTRLALAERDAERAPSGGTTPA